ncbi:hypothetical protein [Hymenobacter psychrophilus]|uniref:Membrane domain of glycerophosphoryl diester phosphodiesterase n=1 Tax=Hymenobacter psychrophilus TaxID=651662 RepID=A0A1H3FTH2_9BACT|nr:hypothetical protein [Hymenobacter psychrophilus]SDX94220.1 hypothetical protein SAMN04488069_104219 [Hymenobacter psychrophilus]
MRRYLAFNRPTDFLRRRDFSQKMEATFDFIRAHATPLARVLVVLVLPLALLTGIGTSLLQSQLMQAMRLLKKPTSSNSTLTSAILPDVFTSSTLWLTMLSGILLFAVVHLVVFGYVVLQADRTTDEPVTAGEVWQVVKSRFLGMVGSFIGLGLLFVVASMVVGGVIFGLGSTMSSAPWMIFPLVLLLYIGIFYSFVPLSLYFIVWLREGRGFFGSLTRSFRLAWGKWWSTFGLLMVITFIMYLILILSVTALTALGLPFAGMMGGELDTGTMRVLMIVYSILQSLVTLLYYPFILIALSFQYFNLVERLDGTGTRLMVEAIGAPVPVAAPQGLRPDDEGEY